MPDRQNNGKIGLRWAKFEPARVHHPEGVKNFPLAMTAKVSNLHRMSTPDVQNLAKPKEQKKAQWVPPRGIRLLDMPHCAENPKAVQWRVDGKRKTKNFPTKDAQINFAKSLAGDAKRDGVAALRLNPDEAREWRAFRAQIGTGVPLDSVLTCWQRHGSPNAPTVSTLMAFYFELREREKGWGESALKHAEKHLGRFAKKFGGRPGNQVSTGEIRDWLDELEDDDGNPLDNAHTIKDHLKNIRTFFSYAVRERKTWLVTENPCDAIVAPKTDDGDPVVIPVRDAFTFFKANLDEPVAGRIALEAFGFIRSGTAGRIEKAGIDFDRRGIRMAARIHKQGQVDGRSRYRQGHPENLWDWLSNAGDPCWDMDFRTYKEEKKHAGIRAGIRPVENKTEGDSDRLRGLRNIWRHSCISYHLARFDCPALTQRLAQHVSYKQTEDYEGMADKVAAARYYMITRETVKLSWEEFCALPIKPLPKLSAEDIAALLAKLS